MSDRIKDKQVLSAHVQQMERNIEENHIEQQSLEDEIQSLEKDIVPEKTFEKKKQYEKQRFELKEKNNLYKKMQAAFETEQQERDKRQRQLRVSLIVLAAVTLGLAIFSFISQNMLFGAVFAVLTVVFAGGIFFIRSKEIGHNETFTKEIEDLKKQVHRLESKYNLNFDLDTQVNLREQWHNAVKAKEVLQSKMGYHEDTRVKAQQDLDEASAEVTQIKAGLHVSDKMSDALLIDSIATIQKIKAHREHVEILTRKKAEIEGALNAFYEHAERVTAQQFTHFSRLSLFHDVRQWLKVAEDNKAKSERNAEQIQVLTNELKHLKSRLSDNTEVIQQLFSFIGALDEESYYRHHERFQHYHKQLERFQDLSKYLENQNYGYEQSSNLSDKTTAQLEQERDKLAAQVDEYNDNFLTLQAEVSDLNSLITQMETDTTLTDLRHRYYILRTQLNENAQDWASLSYLQALVDAHIKQIKDKRLPEVVNEATSIFAHLTQGNYAQVIYNDDQVRVRHKNGQMFQPAELSQSTKEILYIALRLSLIKTLKPYYPFPIIIDDAFVHFDKQRKDIMMSYIRNMPKDYQVLYFTCNKDTNIPSKQMVVLNKIEEGGKE